MATVLNLRNSSGGLTPVSSADPVPVSQVTKSDWAINASATFTRPNDTTTYAGGDLVANSTTAGSVTPMAFTVAPVPAGSFFVRRCRLYKSGANVNNAAFRLHLWSVSPTPANGDNGAFSTSGSASYLGALDVPSMLAFTDGAAGSGYPLVGSSITVKLSSGQIVYGLLEARGAYPPAASEVFTAVLEAE